MTDNKLALSEINNYFITDAGIHLEFDEMLPSEFLSSRIHNLLSEFHVQCPQNSKIRAGIKWVNDTCEATVEVLHSTHVFSSSAIKTNPFDSLREVIYKLREQLREWRKNRFGPEAVHSHELKVVRKEGADLMKQGKNLKVLFVDDDPISIKLLESCFRQQGCETLIADSGVDALQMIGLDKYDLIVLDWNMPDLNGDDVIRMSEGYFEGKETVKTPVLTYSITSNSEIEFPDSKYYTRLGHLKKTMSYQRLKDKTHSILNQLHQNLEFNSNPTIHA